MKPRAIRLAWLGLVLFGLSGTATAAPVLSPSLVTEETAVEAGRAFAVGVHFSIPSGWHLYWRNPGDSGQAPKIAWQLPAGFSVGEIDWPVPERLPAGPLVNYGYSDELLLATRVVPPSVLPGQSVTLAASVKWLACKDICIPGEAHLSLALPVATSAPVKTAASATLFDRFRARSVAPLPRALRASASATDQGFQIRLDGIAPDAKGDARFLPYHRYQINNVAPQAVSRDEGSITIGLKRSELLEAPPELLEGVVVVGNTAYAIAAPLSAPGGLALLVQAIGLALLGGLILNLMPCVFPVLSIKAISLIGQAGQAKREVRLHGLAYGAGVVVSFWVMAGVLIALRAGGEKLGWGFQLQSPAFTAALALLLFGMALNLVGVFEFSSALSGVGSDLATKGGLLGSFFTGVLATVVATPCTAPFMGTALGFALAQPPASALAVFTALAVGLALPYVLLSFTPAMARFLPRPGRWMETVKQFMAFPLIGTVIWLAWVVGLQGGLVVLTKLLVALLLLSIAGWSFNRFHGVPSRIASGVVLGAAVFIGVVGARATAGPGDALKWEPYSHARVAELRDAGKPVFVDFTAAWCVTCKVNETVALAAPEVAGKMRERGVTPLKGDWTNSDAEITQALAELGRTGVPLYVLYSGKKGDGPVILPQLLTTQTVIEALNKLN